MPDNGITPQLLSELLECNFETGELFWKKRRQNLFATPQACVLWNAKHAGKRAFTYLKPKNYYQGRIFKKSFMAHRVIWCLAYGEWPKHQIDHINGKRDDNRLSNLRSVNKAQNAKNQRPRDLNTSGVHGVYWLKNCKKWRAFIYENYQKIHLGLFDNIEQAKIARKNAEKIYGYHKNHGLSVKEIANAE